MSRVVNGDRIQVGAVQLAEIFQVTTTLTNAQIKALPTTPITLVAAPGASFVIVPMGGLLFAKTTGGAYTNIHAAGFLTTDVGGVNLSLANVPNDAAITNASAVRLTDLLGGAANKCAYLVTYADTEGLSDWGTVPTILSTSAVANTALKISIGNGGAGALTGGHAANTLTVVLTYQIITVP